MKFSWGWLKFGLTGREGREGREKIKKQYCLPLRPSRSY
jgi:hypothetical protein